ncbi:MAG TPA: response regulator transcription factor [Thermoleophilaceae bacterium]
MASVASRDWSGRQAAALALASIASSEAAAWAALAVLEQADPNFEAAHLGAGPAAAERLDPATDVVLILGEGLELEPVVQAARRRAADFGIVVVLPSATRGETRRLLAAGADALVLEHELQDVLAVAVRSASLGQLSVPRPLREAIEPPPLSQRDRQIVAFVAAGWTNAQIAERLSLAEGTVKAHLSSVFRQLGVRSRRQAAAALLASDDEVRRSVLTVLRR